MTTQIKSKLFDNLFCSFEIQCRTAISWVFSYWYWTMVINQAFFIAQKGGIQTSGQDFWRAMFSWIFDISPHYIYKLLRSSSFSKNWGRLPWRKKLGCLPFSKKITCIPLSKKLLLQHNYCYPCSGPGKPMVVLKLHLSQHIAFSTSKCFFNSIMEANYNVIPGFVEISMYLWVRFIMVYTINSPKISFLIHFVFVIRMSITVSENFSHRKAVVVYLW